MIEPIQKHDACESDIMRTFVSWHSINESYVKSHWHRVYWPSVSYEIDLPAFEYGDRELHHAWTYSMDHAYFEDAGEAAQFALLFGG